MKGVILAGGNGRRMSPVTDVTNKHLLPIYNKPMIFYPLETLLNAGIKDIVVVTGKEYAGGFLKLLGSGKSFGARFTFEIQEEAGGIAQALSLADHIIDQDDVAVILGDNIFEDNFLSSVQNFKGGAHIFLKEIEDARRFGVAEIQGDTIIGIEEKPANPKSNLAVTGFYIYDNTVFDVIKNIVPSGRGELEITDVNNHYIQNGAMGYSVTKGAWTDAGTFESFYRANGVARQLYIKAMKAKGELLTLDDEK